MNPLRDHILAYFVRHPDEDVTARYVANRWCVPVRTAGKALESMRSDGLLRVADRRDGLALIYEPTEALHNLPAGR